MREPPLVIERAPRWGFLEWFVVAQVLLPGILYFPGTQALRVPIRMAPFALSLLGFVFWRNHAARTPSHPSQRWLIWAMVYLILMIGHPTTNTLLAGIAQMMMYFAVMAPIFWAHLIVKDHRQLERVLKILLVLHGLNAVMGILQVYDPTYWLPHEFSKVWTQGALGLDPLTFIGPNGQRLYRPTGFSDNPGAAAPSGMIVGILGMIFLAGSRNVFEKTAALAFSVAGVAVIYLTHVRASLVILFVMLVVYVGRLLLTRWKLRAIFLGFMTIGVAGLAFRMAVQLGGESIGVRFQTLASKDPLAVYQKNRGEAMESEVANYLKEYPFGAGLGRWGMMSYYFGDPHNPDSPPLWAEIQMPAWILDGGIIVLVFYLLALGIAVLQESRIIRSTADPVLKFWGTGIFAMNLGIIGTMFGSCPFSSQLGIQYWLLAGVLHGAAALPPLQNNGSLRPH